MRSPTVALFALLFFVIPVQAQPTPEQRMACERDAFKYCEHAIPDEERVRLCLIANMRRLNPVCRSAFRKGKARRRN
jgi:hypothetical protein